MEVDVRNGVVALEQARARLEAAMRNRDLEQQLFDGEARRFRLGASTPYNVAVQQRDLINAQSRSWRRGLPMLQRASAWTRR